MPIQISTEIGNNFCYAPWTNLHINTEGDYKTCCAGTTNLGKLTKVPITEILSDKKLIEIKQAIYSNQYHENCRACEKVEQHSSSSERGWYNSIAENQNLYLEKIENSLLQNLDIRWSNICNLSCVYCDSYASSQWASLTKIPHKKVDYKNTLDSILEFINQNKKTLRQISLLGGEPLLQKENDSLLDVIDDSVTIYVITNLNVPLENNKIFQKLILKLNVVWDISFETVEEKFEYVRHGGSWDLLVKNIKLLKDNTVDRPGHRVSVTSQYSIYNALELNKIYQSFADYNFPDMRWSELHTPSILSVAKLPPNFIDRAVKELEICIQHKKSNSFLKEMLASLKTVNSITKNCNNLYKWHDTQEKYFWPNFKYKFANLWPEYNECF